MQRHEDWMRLALNLAQATTGQTGSNPMVGAVVVKEGRIIGQGVHLQRGEAHAEVHALRMAGEQARGGTIYVTLEPCNHQGNTPPCTEAILQAGLERVVIGSTDPDVRVAGQGIARLQQAGLDVIPGVLASECDQMNEAYFHHRITGLPFVTLKMATTLDGKIATSNGDSRWITNEASRQRVHELRDQYQAILVGVNTVNADDPALTCRLPVGGKNPLRVVVDSKLRTQPSAKIADVKEAPTLIFTTDPYIHSDRAEQLRSHRVQVIAAGSGPHVDFSKLLQYLGEQGILSLLVEGGSAIHGSLLAEQRVQKVITFMAPKLLGGANSLTAVAGPNPKWMSEAIHLTNLSWESFGDDLCITGYPKF